MIILSIDLLLTPKMFNKILCIILFSSASFFVLVAVVLSFFLKVLHLQIVNNLCFFFSTAMKIIMFSMVTTAVALMIIVTDANPHLPSICPSPMRPGASCNNTADCPILEPYCNSKLQFCNHGFCCSFCTKQ